MFIFFILFFFYVYFISILSYMVVAFLFDKQKIGLQSAMWLVVVTNLSHLSGLVCCVSGLDCFVSGLV